MNNLNKEMQSIEKNKESEEDNILSREQILADIGQKLCQARQARGESIEKPVRTLKLHLSHLQALEGGDWSSLPDEVYALGFLRQYARYLEINLEHELDLLKNQQYRLTKPLTFPDPPVAPSRRWAWIAGASFLLLFIAFNIFDTGSKPQVIEYPDEAESVASVSDYNPPAPVAQESETSPAEESIPPQASDETAEPVTNLPATPAAVVNMATHDGADSAQPPSGLSHPKPDLEKIAIAEHSYRFDAVTDAVWLQIYLPNESGDKGKLAKEVLLNPGHHITLTAASDHLWITCGNTPALKVSVDGRTLIDTGELSSGKKILRDYKLTITQ